MIAALVRLLGIERFTGIDDRQAPSGGLIVPVRAFSRSLSSGSVQDALAQRLVSVHDRYPTPRVDASYALSIDDEASPWAVWSWPWEVRWRRLFGML